MDRTDPTGQIAFFDDVIGAGVGGLVGLAVETGKDEVLEGRLPTWGEGAGAFAGGALLGDGIVNAPETLGGSVIAAGALRGGVVGFVSNQVQQGTDISTGAQKGYSVTSAVVSTAAGTLTGGVISKVGTVKVPGVSSGRNNFAATAKGVRTRIANGNAQHISTSTAVKGAVGGQVGDAGRTAVGGALDGIKSWACKNTGIGC